MIPTGGLFFQTSQEDHQMAASLKTVREKMDVQPTPENKGLILTLRVTAYDNGLIHVDGQPCSSGNPIDPTLSWLLANQNISIAFTEFYRQISKRKEGRTS
jgi:hypothetical protein